MPPFRSTRHICSQNLFPNQSSCMFVMHVTFAPPFSPFFLQRIKVLYLHANKTLQARPNRSVPPKADRISPT